MIIKIGKMAVTAAMLVGTGLAVADVEWKWDESQHVNIAPATVMVSVASVLPNTVQTLNTRQFGTYGRKRKLQCRCTLRITYLFRVWSLKKD